VFFTGYNKDGIWRFFPFFRKKALILLVFYHQKLSAGAAANAGADAKSFGQLFRTILI
tara:strand:+ start:1445 stop:1618 length:174 start_codon:yes stop_codon:yes gene_type:complete